ncbi:MAG: glycosyltransferase family 4 protein, partial [Candidatus Aminicenantes bacterium]|nr:glycosyltransferase family 4 protein [Candidatus Aminicenantes bacterium]
MKILFVMGGLRFGGYEVLNVEIANQLIERGFEVSIISFSKEDQLLSRVSDSIDIFYVDKSSKLSALLEVRKALKIIKPDIILSCDILEYLIPRIGSVFLKHKARFIYAFHVTKPPTKKDHFWNKVLSFSDRIFRDNKIAIHRSQIDFYNSNYSLSEERFSLIYNGVDTEKFCPAVKREESAGDIIRLVHVASLKPLKDQWTLLKAMVELNKNSKDWELNIAGSDVAGLKSEYSIFLKGNGLESKVNFLGPVKDVRSLL